MTDLNDDAVIDPSGPLANPFAMLVALAAAVGQDLMKGWAAANPDIAEETAMLIQRGAAVIDVNVRGILTPAPVVELVLRSRQGEAVLEYRVVPRPDASLTVPPTLN
jgi:hypothetical protein